MTQHLRTQYVYGVLDRDGLRGSNRTRLGLADVSNDDGRLVWKQAFTGHYPEFRRFDLMSRAVTMTTEAAGLDHLGDDQRRDCAILLSTAIGCLDADLGFQASLGADTQTASGLFPHTLPSTCLSSVAIRHRLQGPTIAWVTDADQELLGLQYAADLIESQEASSALVLLGNALSKTHAATVGLESQLCVAAVWGNATTFNELSDVVGSGSLLTLIRHLDAQHRAESC